MEVYDQNGNLLEEYDLEKGHLVEDIRIIHHDAVERVCEQGHYEMVAEYEDTGGKDVAWVVDVPGAEPVAAWDEEKVVYIYIPYTDEELADMEKNKQAGHISAVVYEVTAALVTAQINTLAVDDATALRWRVLYPVWAVGVTYAAGEKVQYGDKLYKCFQGHTSEERWTPDEAPALWTEICETHAGTLEDPIPYSGNMVLEQGKYYEEDGVVYLCNRDTVNPVYHHLADLVGLYVEVVTV